MAFKKTRFVGAAFGLALLIGAVPALADTITANCTGMLNLDKYEFDTDLAEQDVAGIGLSEFSINELEIRLLGDFGEYRFDLKVGTLYHNGSDTGLYCTYRTEES